MTDEYIKRDTAYNYLTEYYNHRTDIQHQNLRKALNAIPSADVVEVKHGKWINPRVDSEMCSACGTRFFISGLFAVGGNDEPNFCPNCGADMRGGTDG